FYLVERIFSRPSRRLSWVFPVMGRASDARRSKLICNLHLRSTTGKPIKTIFLYIYFYFYYINPTPLLVVVVVVVVVVPDHHRRHLGGLVRPPPPPNHPAAEQEM